ncbi:MAG: flagellar hook-basal body complex protein FliE [Corallincola sp.]|nr:flagellar hook-basal body complex protein FliE [Corallincola sp.]
MRIDANPLQADMLAMLREARSGLPGLGQDPMAALGGGASPVSTVSPAGERFAVMLRQAVDGVNDLQKTSSDMQTRFDMGDRSLSLSDVMIASQKSSIAFTATVQVRNKLVEAYKEVMSMTV